VAKRCSIGKSCGATCIDGREDCLIELGPEASGALSKVRDLLVKVKGEVVSNAQPLDNPGKAVDWLVNNRENLASWAMPDDVVNKIIKDKPAMITFGVEPGIGPMVVGNLADLKHAIPALKDAPVVKDLQRQANGPWGDQLLKVNSYKIANEASNILNKLDPQNFPENINQAGKQLASAGLNVDAALNYLNYLGMVKGDKLEGYMNYDKVVQNAAKSDGKILWETANGLIQKGAGLQGEGVFGANPSGLWKPSQQFGQFKELFDAAGRSAEAGPFASNGKWYKYSGQVLGDKVMKVVREGQPKLMYFGGTESDMLKKRVAEEFGKSGTFTLEAKTKDGKLVDKKFEYFLYQQPNGSYTVAMFGPHTGALGFKSNRSLMEATGEIARGLIESGTVPRQIENANVTNVGPVKSQGPTKVKAVPAATRQSQANAVLKELRGESKVAKPQVDKGKQLAGVKLLAENLKKQGYGAVRIREELRKMGVSPALISEVV
jgi:hypothetical protein